MHFYSRGGLAIVLVLFGALTRSGFVTMVNYTAPIFWLYMLLVSAAFFMLRRQEPDKLRPFQVPLYPIPPLLFFLTNFGRLVASLRYTGIGGIAGATILLVGLPMSVLTRMVEEETING